MSRLWRKLRIDLHSGATVVGPYREDQAASHLGR